MNLKPRPYATYLFIFINVTVFIFLALMGVNVVDPTPYSLYQWGGLFPPAMAENGEWWRLITSMFLHGGILHLFVNSYSLYNVGPMLEFFLGKKSYISLYLLSGFIAALVVYFFSPQGVTVGASGAIFGVFTAEMGLFLKYKKYVSKEFYRRAIKSFIIIIGLNLGLGFSFAGISNAGHIGGAIAGFLLIFIPPFTSRFEKRRMYLFFN